MLPETLEFFARYIEQELGIVFDQHNFFQLQKRIEDVCHFYAVGCADDLLKIAKMGMPGTMKQYLLDMATNNETLFFRDAKVFNSLQTDIVPGLLEKFSASKLEIWSAACSSGQEPYSVSMILSDFVNQNKLKDFEIKATDISSRILEKAKKGRYTQLEVQRGLPTPLLMKHFKKTEDNFWDINEEIKRPVKFSELNLKSQFDFRNQFHLILCRNVLIYQKLPAKIEIIRKLVKCLHPEGYLLLGAGETLLGLDVELEQSFVNGVSVYRHILKNRMSG